MLAHMPQNQTITTPSVWWTLNTKAVGTVMANRKEMPKEKFSRKLKMHEKLSTQRNHILTIKWCDMRDVYILSTVHDKMVDASPASK
jgi:hypothetical protein